MSIFRAVFAFFLIAFGVPALAGNAILYQPVPQWVEQTDPAAIMAQKPNSNKFFVVLDRQVKVEKGEQQVYADLVMRVNSTEFLAQIGTLLRGYWQPDRGDLIIHRLEILRDGKTINALENGTKFDVMRQEKGLDGQQINGVLTAAAQIQTLQLGDIVRYSFTATSSNAALGGRAETISPLGAADIETDFDRIRIIWPKSEKLDYKISGDDITGKLSEQGDYSVLTLPAMAPKQPEMPKDSPMRFQIKPNVATTGFANWEDVSKTAAALYQTQGLIEPGSPLAAEVDKIRAASQDPVERSALALRLVQDKVRYLYNGLGFGNYQPQTPSETWQLRYGDCKAKTLLLLSILHALDIEAEAALVGVAAKDMVSVMPPAFQMFDHVIVRAKIGDRTLWLDGTGMGTRQADLFDIPPHRYALPLTSAGAPLLQLSTAKPGRPEQDVAVRYDVTAGLALPAFFEVKLKLRDADSYKLRSSQTQSTPKAFREELYEIAGKYVIDAMVSEASFNYNEESGEGELTAKGISYLEWNKKDGSTKHHIWSTIDDNEMDVDRKRREWRAIPYDLGNGGFYREDTSFALPNAGTGFTLDGTATTTQSVGGYVLERATSLADGAVRFREDYYLNQWEIPSTEIPTEVRKLARLKKDDINIVAPKDYPEKWQELKTALASKKLDAYKKLFDQVIADNPKEELSYRQRASFYQQIGDYNQAAKDVAEALKLEPTAESFHWLGTLLRTSAPKASITALKEALKIEPSHYDSVDELSEIYAYSGQTKEAMQVIEDGYEAGLDDNDAESLRAYTDLAAGKKEEAIARLDTLLEDSPDDPSLLIARCWYKAIGNIELESALEDCGKAIQLSDSAAVPLSARGFVHYRLGEFKEALADYDAALAISPGYASAYYQRALTKSRLGDTAGSENDLNTARYYDRDVSVTLDFFGVKP